MEKNRRGSLGSNFVVQGSILAAAGIVVRIIGLVYRIPLMRILGDDGNGYYTAAFNIYSILLIISSYSLPTAVSKLVSARIGLKQYRSSIRIFFMALVYALTAGGIASVALWFGADFLAGMVKMPFAAYALKTLAPTVLIMAFLGVLRGYFQGLGTMLPTAVSQILEQIINAVVSIGAAWYLFQEGLKVNVVKGSDQYAYAYSAAGGTIGTGAGAIAALLFCLLLMSGYQKIMRRQWERDQSRRQEGYGTIAWWLALTILPIVLSSTVYNISSVIDNTIFGQAMDALGQGELIAAHWGVFGYYHTLFMIPVAISNALASSLIPSLARAVAERSRAVVLDKVSATIRFSMLIAIPSTVGMMVLSSPINRLLFSSQNMDLLIKVTAAGALAVVFYSLSTVTNAILQGTNHMGKPLLHAAVSLGLHVIILLVMLYRFKWGIYGVVFANVLFALIICILNQRAISRLLRYRQEYKKTFLLPLLASAVMGAVAYGTYFLLDKLLPSGQVFLAVTVVAAIIAALLTYVFCLFFFRAVEPDELLEMPGGRKIVKILQKTGLK